LPALLRFMVYTAHPRHHFSSASSLSGSLGSPLVHPHLSFSRFTPASHSRFPLHSLHLSFFIFFLWLPASGSLHLLPHHTTCTPPSSLCSSFPTVHTTRLRFSPCSSLTHLHTSFHTTCLLTSFHYTVLPLSAYAVSCTLHATGFFTLSLPRSFVTRRFTFSLCTHACTPPHTRHTGFLVPLSSVHLVPAVPAVHVWFSPRLHTALVAQFLTWISFPPPHRAISHSFLCLTTTTHCLFRFSHTSFVPHWVSPRLHHHCTHLCHYVCYTPPLVHTTTLHIHTAVYHTTLHSHHLPCGYYHFGVSFATFCYRLHRPATPPLFLPRVHLCAGLRFTSRTYTPHWITAAWFGLLVCLVCRTAPARHLLPAPLTSLPAFICGSGSTLYHYRATATPLHAFCHTPPRSRTTGSHALPFTFTMVLHAVRFAGSTTRHVHLVLAHPTPHTSTLHPALCLTSCYWFCCLPVGSHTTPPLQDLTATCLLVSPGFYPPCTLVYVRFGSRSFRSRSHLRFRCSPFTFLTYISTLVHLVTSFLVCHVPHLRSLVCTFTPHWVYTQFTCTTRFTPLHLTLPHLTCTWVLVFTLTSGYCTFLPGSHPLSPQFTVHRLIFSPPPGWFATTVLCTLHTYCISLHVPTYSHGSCHYLPFCGCISHGSFTLLHLPPLHLLPACHTWRHCLCHVPAACWFTWITWVLFAVYTSHRSGLVYCTLVAPHHRTPQPSTLPALPRFWLPPASAHGHRLVPPPPRFAAPFLVLPGFPLHTPYTPFASVLTVLPPRFYLRTFMYHNTLTAPPCHHAVGQHCYGSCTWTAAAPTHTPRHTSFSHYCTFGSLLRFCMDSGSGSPCTASLPVALHAHTGYLLLRLHGLPCLCLPRRLPLPVPHTLPRFLHTCTSTTPLGCCTPGSSPHTTCTIVLWFGFSPVRCTPRLTATSAHPLRFGFTWFTPFRHTAPALPHSFLHHTRYPLSSSFFSCCTALHLRLHSATFRLHSHLIAWFTHLARHHTATTLPRHTHAPFLFWVLLLSAMVRSATCFTHLCLPLSLHRSLLPVRRLLHAH